MEAHHIRAKLTPVQFEEHYFGARLQLLDLGVEAHGWYA